MAFIDLDLAKQYHGHLGPNLVFGLKMGNYAVAKLQARTHFGLSAEVFCSEKPPASCIIDGVQLATGCTMGKANISHVVCDQDAVVRVVNTDNGASVAMRLKPGVREQYLKYYREKGEEEASFLAWEAADEEIFEECCL